WGNSGINPDTANPGPGRPGLQADLHLPRAAEPAQPVLHDERLDADADVDERHKRATNGGATMNKPAPSPAEQCAACGHGAHGNHVCPGCLMGCGSSLPPPAPSPATPCSVYPCPCACHRLGPHVPTGECYEAASDVLTEGRFRSLADCATGYLVRDD